MSLVSITLLGRPVPGNERHRTKSGFRFLPKRQADALAALRLAASEAMNGRPMLEGPLRIAMTAEMPIPVSWPKKRQSAAARHSIWPTVKPDLKNLLWMAEDALTSIVYNDDKQICIHSTVKQYSTQPGLYITVEEMYPEELV